MTLLHFDALFAVFMATWALATALHLKVGTPFNAFNVFFTFSFTVVATIVAEVVWTVLS